LIFDKSFLQMLNPAEVFELSLRFSPVGTPTLIREIIADLKKIREGELPEELVSALARKMWSNAGVQPANFRIMALANLCGRAIPMFGQVPVDTSADNVSEVDGMMLVDSVPEQRMWQRWAEGADNVSEVDGMMLVDSVPEQRMWQRWAEGNFNIDDEESASAWRNSLQQINLRAVGDGWKKFARKWFGTASNLRELIDQANAVVGSEKLDIQLELLGILLSLLGATEPGKNFIFNRFLAKPMTLEDFAPYASTVLKLYLTFVGGLARGFLGPRPSHYVDLQYLFYAPFCMVFASADKFHREMWPATSGINSFVWGPELKADLSNRVASRDQMSAEERKRIAEEYDFYPVEIPGSIVTEMWRMYMLPKEEIMSGRRDTKTIDDLEPEIRDLIRSAQREFKRRDGMQTHEPGS
jgi:hypothetical protein